MAITENISTPKSIAVTGGKGGTGKTLISVNLAVQFAREGKKILLIDCDTENPNSNILLGKSLTDSDVKSEPVNIFVPIFDDDLCTKCGDCRSACYRHAIIQFLDTLPSLMENMCSGCTLCQRICPTNAIKSGQRAIGTQYFMEGVKDGLDLLLGELNEGEAVSVLIVEELLERAEKLQKTHDYDLIIIDTAPGAHCDVEKSLSEATIIVCVTEPTPFGEHDLNRILDLIDIIERPATVIINRADITDYKEQLLKLANKRNVEILGEIPMSRDILEAYARGIPFVADGKTYSAKNDFLNIFNKIQQRVAGKETEGEN